MNANRAAKVLPFLLAPSMVWAGVDQPWKNDSVVDSGTIGSWAAPLFLLAAWGALGYVVIPQLIYLYIRLRQRRSSLEERIIDSIVAFPRITASLVILATLAVTH